MASSYDITNYTKKYQYSNYTLYSPYISLFTNSYMTLINNSTTITMTQRYMYRPDYVSYDYYNTVDLWYLILKVNKVLSITQFNIPNIIIPNKSTVMSLMSQLKVNSSQVNSIVPLGGN